MFAQARFKNRMCAFVKVKRVLPLILQPSLVDQPATTKRWQRIARWRIVARACPFCVCAYFFFLWIFLPHNYNLKKNFNHNYFLLFFPSTKCRKQETDAEINSFCYDSSVILQREERRMACGSDVRKRKNLLNKRSRGGKQINWVFYHDSHINTVYYNFFQLLSTSVLFIMTLQKQF